MNDKLVVKRIERLEHLRMTNDALRQSDDICTCMHKGGQHLPNGKCNGSVNYEEDGSLTRRNLHCRCEKFKANNAVSAVSEAS